ncbi:50S ribosomal protein L29 [Patescibacteria group bacterium]|nr:50S ribosomal protein L29 [Patescibacteria group bacterium]
MKIKEKKQLSEKNIKELRVSLREAKEQLFSLKLEKMQMKLKNMKAIFLKKRDVAQIATTLRAKEMENAKNV